MRLLLINILLLLTCVMTMGQPSDPEVLNDPFRKKIKGSVRAITCISRQKSTRDDDVFEYFKDSTIYYFNEDNVVLKAISFDAYGSKKVESYFYDSLKNMKRQVSTDEKDRTTKEVFFEYDQTGQLSRRLEKSESSAEYEIIFGYEQGRMISQRLIYIQSRDSINHFYKFDRSGNMIEEIEDIPKLSYGSGGYHKVRYEYSNSNLLMTRQEFERDNTITNTTRYTYDKNSLLIKAELRHKDSSPYDNTKTFRYKNGDLIELTSTFGNSTLNERKECKYEFDQKGNLVRKLIYNNGVLQTEVKCRITYR